MEPRRWDYRPADDEERERLKVYLDARKEADRRIDEIESDVDRAWRTYTRWVRKKRTKQTAGA